jgi:tRNA nucleotidyltransferase (CCA-adding enzyme)
MAYHPKTGVSDFFGGQADLAAGIIRCVGAPDMRFNEDALRILRALRFAARLGFTIEENTAAAIHRNKELLHHIAAERIREELTGLLCGSCAEPILRQYHDVLSVPIPELAPLAGFKQHNRHHCHDVWGHTVAAVSAIPNDPPLRWAALLHDTGKPACFTMDEKGVGHFYGHAADSANIAAAVTNRLRFDNATRDTVCFLVEQHHLFTEVSEKSVRRAMLRFGRERLEKLLFLLRADTLGHAPCCFYHLDDIRNITDIMASIPDFTVKDLAVNGKDLMALGYSGPQIGQTLNLLLETVVFSGIPNEKYTLLNYLTQD